MKKLFLLVIASWWLTRPEASAQLLLLQSKDSLNGKPKKVFYTTAWVKLSGFYDFQGIPNLSAMNLPSIPTERDSLPADPQFYMDLYQTRLKFASTFQTRFLGEIFSYIETDFYGNGGGGMRLRMAYVRFKNLRIGRAWSVFTDEEAWPNITDFDGPATGIWVFSEQIAYYFRLNKKSDLVVAIETPSIDYARYLLIDTLVTPSKQHIPDVVSHYEYRYNQGHFQIGGVARLINFTNPTGNRNYSFAGGVSISGSQQLFGRDKFIYQAVWGRGISKYMVSFGGGGWDAVPDYPANQLDLVPLAGGYLSYQLFWGKKNYDTRQHNHLSSTFVYGYVQLNNPIETPRPTLLTGHWMSANVYWHVVGPLNIAVEAIHGIRTDEFESRGDNTRILLVVEYNF